MRTNKLACGVNHSIVIAPDKQVYVWGRSTNDELGVHELKGFVQTTPFHFVTEAEGSLYTALEVACGDSHTAVLLRDNSLPKLNLLYSSNLDISNIFSDITKRLDEFHISLSSIHAERWKNAKKLKREDIEDFFQEFCFEYLQHGTEIIDLLMTKGIKDKILYKEFRDQLYCTRLDDGRVLTWGSSENGRLGRPENSEERLVIFDQGVSITKISCGGSHTLAISSGRKLYAWGANAYGQLGVGHTKDCKIPVLVSIDADNLQDIAGGGSHSLALSSEGKVFAWGLGEGGRLGHGECNLALYPKRVSTISDAEFVAAGHSHSGCIVKGEIYTWGIGTYGRLGHGNLAHVDTPRLVEFFKGRFIDKLCLSFFHSIALSSNGEIWSWGNSKNGRLGIPTSNGENQLIPVRVGVGSLMGECEIIDIACGYKHCLALAKTGYLFAWGCGLDGKLGFNINSGEEPIPKEVQFPKGTKLIKVKKKKILPLKSTKITSISCSSFNTYCLTNAGELLVCGSNAKGQCGVPNSNKGCELTKETKIPLECAHLRDHFSPILLLLEAFKLVKFKQIASNGETGMAVTNDGKVFVWGSNEQGQLGTGFSPDVTYQESPQPLAIFKRVDIKSVSCGGHHTAFLAANGEVHVCGSSENGRLGLGETVMHFQNPYQYIPRIVIGLPNIKKVACGYSHTIALDDSNHIWSWGSGWFGKLGLGNTVDRITPTMVPSNSFYPHLKEQIKEIACGEYHTLLMTAQGSLYSAGLGIYAGIWLHGTNEILYFNKIESIDQVKQIAVGRDHSIVVTKRGQLYGWGKNSFGKLGTGVYDNEAEILECRQILISKDITFIKVSAGSNHSAAISEENNLYVWGNASSGRLGLGIGIDDIIAQPTENLHLKNWLNINDALEEENEEEDFEEQYALQSLLKNEPIEQSMETLLSQDQQIVSRLESILIKFDQVREIQNERENLLSYIDSLIFAKIETIKSISNPDFQLTIPLIISKNYQLYEFLLACMQTHPCYIAKLVQYNPHLPTTEIANVFKAIYGDLSNSPQKLRRLMQLYKLTLKISISNREFHKSVKMEPGDLSTYIYFYLLQSQNCNNLFYACLASEIMKIIYKVSNNNEKAKRKKIIDEEPEEEHTRDPNSRINEVDEYAEQDTGDENKVSSDQDRFFKQLLEQKHKIRDALNYKQLEQFGELPPELNEIYNKRKNLYLKASKKVKKKIYNILTHNPTIRKRVNPNQKISNEIKFLYKDIPSLFRERFQEQCNTLEGKNILESKIVLLFLAPLIEILREPLRLKRISIEEFQKSMGDVDFDEFISIYSSGFNLMADFIEELGEYKKEGFEIEKSLKELRRSKKKKSTSCFVKNCMYRRSLVEELTNVPDLNLTDLSLGDMLSTSLEPDDSTLTISLESLCNLNLLLRDNQESIKENFGIEDPVYIIINSLGKVKTIFKKILSGDSKFIKINLKLPTRWLLRERALQSCKECKTPLTYSLLRNPPPEDQSDVPFTVPTLWKCLNCGNTQDGWHMKCLDCQAARRDFPQEALFKNFKENYRSEELKKLSEILYQIPPVPPHTSPLKFIKNLMEKQPKGSYLLQKMKVFIERLEEYGNFDVDQNQRAEENIQKLEIEAKHEYNNRASHKSYLDTMNNILRDIEDKIKLTCLQFNQNTSLTLKKAALAIAKGKNLPENANLKIRQNKNAQGRFTIDYLIKRKILTAIDLPEAIKKNASAYFTERDNGEFDVRIVIREDRNYLCVPRDPIEVKIIGFEIKADKLKAMRRTMNFRAQTSFEHGKLTFNVFQLVRMLSSLIGKCKQAFFI